MIDSRYVSYFYNDKCGNSEQADVAKRYPDSYVDAIINSRYLGNNIIV